MGENIRPIPFYFRFLPFLHSEMASSIYPNIYLTKKEYEEYQSGSVSILTQSVIIHEQEHLKNWKDIGYLNFPYLYLTNKDWRLEEELRAIKIQMIFLKENNQTYDIERKARQFSGKEYGEVLSYEESVKVLTRLYESI